MQRRKFSLITKMAVLVMFTMSLLVLLPHDGTKAAETQKIKIGFLLKTMQEERYQTDKTLFIARAESLGAEVLFDSSGNDELTQLQQFEKLLQTGVQVIVLQPVNTGTAGSLVKLAHKQGVRVVGYDSMLVNGPLDIMLMQDSWAVGKLQGESMLEWFRQKKGKLEGKVALIMGQPGDANAAALSSGVLKILKDNPGLELIEKRSHVDWSPDQARETADRLLLKNDNKVDAFVCNNSGLASGVIFALASEGLADVNKVFVAGADADLLNIRYIAQGKQAVDVWKKIKPLAYKAADIAVLLAQNPNKAITDVAEGFKMVNNGYTDVPTIITPVVLVTNENIDSVVIKGGLFTKEQVYGK